MLRKRSSRGYLAWNGAVYIECIECHKSVDFFYPLVVSVLCMQVHRQLAIERQRSPIRTFAVNSTIASMCSGNNLPDNWPTAMTPWNCPRILCQIFQWHGSFNRRPLSNFMNDSHAIIYSQNWKWMENKKSRKNMSFDSMWDLLLLITWLEHRSYFFPESLPNWFELRFGCRADQLSNRFRPNSGPFQWHIFQNTRCIIRIH